MKIIAIDNYNTEVISDRLIHENLKKHEGEILLKGLNAHESQWYYRLVEDNHELYVYDPR